MDVIWAKFDGQGNMLWSKQWGSEKLDSGVATAVDGQGNTYRVVEQTMIFLGRMLDRWIFSSSSLGSDGVADEELSLCDSGVGQSRPPPQRSLRIGLSVAGSAFSSSFFFGAKVPPT